MLDSSQAYDKIVEILFRHDPQGLVSLGVPADEYSPEAVIITRHLHSCSSQSQVQLLVFVSFTTMVASDAGHIDDYHAIADEIYWLDK